MRLSDLFVDKQKILKDYAGGCATCPRKLNDYVPPTLRPTRMIIVGEAPGETEVEKQEGFTGKSGQTIRGALRDVGISEMDYSLSNTIHCRPPENRDPKDKEISCCMNEHVTLEVKDYPLVVLSGNIAANAFFPGNATKVRGNLAYHPDFPNSRFFSILHPAAIGYDPKRKEEFYKQIARLGRIFHGDTESNIRTLSSAEFRARWESFLRDTPIISLDLETNQLESWRASKKILSLAAAGVPGEREVFAIDHTDPYWREALLLLKAFLSNPEKQVLGQSVGFDLVFLEEEMDFKCDLKYIHDIQALYYELWGSRDIALKEVVSKELDGYRHLVVWPHLEKNVEYLKLYGGEDVIYPRDLFLRDFPKLRPRTQDLFLRVLGPSMLATRRITNAGIHFRSEAHGPLNKEYRERRNSEIAAWVSEAPEGLSPDPYITEKGTTNLDHYLFDVRKLPVIAMTAGGGERSTDESVIKELIRMGNTDLQHLLNIKGIDKRLSTYITPLPKLVDEDRRIHASYNVTRVNTGRLSSNSPNMQNNPRNDIEYKNQIRWLFGAPVGAWFGDADFSQVELRAAMSLANDPVGKKIYAEGGDIHIETALSILGKGPPDPKMWKKDKYWIDQRYIAKSANFALIYGGQPSTLQEYAKNEYGVIMSDQDAKNWHRGFFQRYPALLPWHQREIQKLRENKGYTETAVGHCWYYADWDSKDGEKRSHAERAVINSTCQGPCAHMMNYLIYLAQQEFWKRNLRRPTGQYAEVVLTVHDSVNWEVNEDQGQESLKAIEYARSVVADWASDWFTVPLVLDTKLVKVWDGEE